MRIEQLTLEHVADVAVLFDDYRRFYEQESDIQGGLAFLKEKIDRNESVILVAKVEDDYAGFTQLYPTFSSVAMKPAYILNDLYVAENYRRGGIAEKLMEEAFEFAMRKNARFVALETALSNKKAQALYEKMGMKTEGEVKHYVRYFD